MFLCLSVILFTRGVGVCLSACWDTLPSGADTPLEQTPQEQTPPEVDTPPWADTPLGADTPPTHCMLGDTGNKRALRILLEWILVVN